MTATLATFRESTSRIAAIVRALAAPLLLAPIPAEPDRPAPASVLSS